MSSYFGVIYEILFPNGKKYIGQTTQVETRVLAYKYLKCKSQPLVYNAIVKYGWSNCKFLILKECQNMEEMNLSEEQLIKKHKTQNRDFGYNITAGGLNKKHTEESKKKIGDWHRGKKLSEKQCKQIGDRSRGKKASEESKRKMSASRSKEKNYLYGKKQPEWLKKQISEKKMFQKSWNSDNTIHNITHPLTGRVFIGTRIEFNKAFGKEWNYQQVRVSGFFRGIKRKLKGWVLTHNLKEKDFVPKGEIGVVAAIKMRRETLQKFNSKRMTDILKLQYINIGRQASGKIIAAFKKDKKDWENYLFSNSIEFIRKEFFEFISKLTFSKQFAQPRPRKIEKLQSEFI